MSILDKLNITPPVAMTAAEIKSFELLMSAARNDTGQSRRVADFLLAWWNATECGAWDPTSLWSLDVELGDAIVTLLGYINRSRCYPDTLGYGPEFKELVRIWRSKSE